MSQRTRREHTNNVILAVLNIAALAVAGLLLEYEVAKAKTPNVEWAQTPSETVFAVAGVIGLGSLLVLAILALVYKKGLANRPYLWWISTFNLIVGVTALAVISRKIGFGTLINFVLFP